MAVAMVDNSYGCLNPSPAGKTTTHNQRHKRFPRKRTYGEGLRVCALFAVWAK